MKKGKRYNDALEKEGYDKGKQYSIDEALEVLSDFPKVKFDESVEVGVKLAIDAKKTDQQVRGIVDLPHGIGKVKKIAVVTSTQEEEAKKVEADVVGGEELIDEISKGRIDFDVLVATPEMMPKLAKVAKILGPRGLMPNPKNQTVGPKVGSMVEGLKKGRASFKTDKTGNVHQVIGKRSFSNEKLKENFEFFIKEGLYKNKPTSLKGKLVKSVSISGSMTPGIKVSIKQ